MHIMNAVGFMLSVIKAAGSEESTVHKTSIAGQRWLIIVEAAHRGLERRMGECSGSLSMTWGSPSVAQSLKMLSKATLISWLQEKLTQR